MESWVYIFSRFTQEALLFEALLIFGGFAAYAAFYITRRRKFGAAGQEIPSSLVKVYLAQLVADAEEMRNQLFGLLGKGEATGKLFNINLIQGGALLQSGEGATAAPAASAPQGAVVDPKWVASPAAAADPQVQGKLKELEAKMQEQARALEAVLNEKMRLEEELAVTKAKPAASGAAAPVDNSIAEKLKTLEAQLAEYAVIEDDLANLKRLQKENKTLRQQLEQARAGAAAPEVPGVETPAQGASASAGDLPEATDRPENEVAANAPEAKQARAETPKAEAANESAAENQSAQASTQASTPDLPAAGETAAAAAAAPAPEKAEEQKAQAATDLPAAGEAHEPGVQGPAKAANEAPTPTLEPAPGLDGKNAAQNLPSAGEKAEATAKPVEPAQTAAGTAQGDLPRAQSSSATSGEKANPAAVPESFDALVDDVEKSLAQAPAAAQTEQAAASTSPAGDKSEEELQADFEKMLKG